MKPQSFFITVPAAIERIGNETSPCFAKSKPLARDELILAVNWPPLDHECGPPTHKMPLSDLSHGHRNDGSGNV